MQGKRAVVSVAVGQAGNMMNDEYWILANKEHRITNQGAKADGHDELEMYHDVLYHEENGRFHPRAVLCDLGQGVIAEDFDSVNRPNFFGQGNIFSAANPAGQAWPRGYHHDDFNGSKLHEIAMDQIRVQMEKCDNPQGVQLFHALGGGTGSGCGSHILEDIKGEYNSKMIIDFAVVPGAGHNESPVHPYNSICSLQYMVEHCNFSVLYDTKSLERITGSNQVRVWDAVIARNALDMSISFRGHSAINSDLYSMEMNLCPWPRKKFLVPSSVPKPTESNLSQYLGNIEARNWLNNQTKWLCEIQNRAQGKIIAQNAIFRGDEDGPNAIPRSEIETQMQGYRSQNQAAFYKFIPDNLKITYGAGSPEFRDNNGKQHLHGSMFTNTTKVSAVFERIYKDSKGLLDQNQFVAGYGISKQELEEFQSATRNLIGEMEGENNDELEAGGYNEHVTQGYAQYEVRNDTDEEDAEPLKFNTMGDDPFKNDHVHYKYRFAERKYMC